MRFYIMPHKEHGHRVRDIIRRKVISYNGGAFKYIHLLTPSKEFGFATPIRDPWATNLSILAAQFDYGTLVGDYTAEDPTRPHLTSPGEWNGLTIGDHIACAALDLVNNILPFVDGKFDITPFDVSRYKPHRRPARLRRICYNIALSRYADPFLEDTTRKMDNLSMIDPTLPHLTQARYFAQHGLNICHKLPAHIRNNQHLLIFNALATDHRRRPYANLPPRGPRANPFPLLPLRPWAGQRSSSFRRLRARARGTENLRA